MEQQEFLDIYDFTDSFCLHVTRYDEEQAQSENAERDLRSRSGQSLGSKGNKGGAGVRPVAATWKWGDTAGSKWSPVYYYRVWQWCTVDKKRTAQLFVAYLLHGELLSVSCTILRAENQVIQAYLESLKAGVCGCFYEWVTKIENYVGAEGQAQSHVSQQQQ